MESLKRARKRAGLSLSELAERCGMLPQAIARAERTGWDVKASTVAAIAKALDIPACELIEGGRHGRPKAK
jgi:transcriptional regulator with XRE-family HTH domain